MNISVPISLYASVRVLECLCAISLLIQTLEFLRLRSETRSEGVWSWQIQRADVSHAPEWLRKVFELLYQDRIHHLHLLLRAGAAASLFAGSSPFSAVLLFASTIVILIRWRGAFNGGSDFMTIVALTGLVIANIAGLWVGPVLAWKAGLWYITIHAMSSYFISGAIKLFSPAWRDGSALSFFLDGGLYGPLSEHSVFRKPIVAITCSWAFILWECCFPLTMAGPAWAVLGCGIAALFHFLVFRFFGLNRFFWAWAVNFPAIVYCSAQW
ncbi:MAG: hypothetical protein RI928_2466 [Pseudomonadota bacterium]|jgi:hypothetical protein